MHLKMIRFLLQLLFLRKNSSDVSILRIQAMFPHPDRERGQERARERAREREQEGVKESERERETERERERERDFGLPHIVWGLFQ